MDPGYIIQLQYKVIYSFLIILPLIPNPFHLSTVLVFRSLYTNLRYGYTRKVVASSESSYDMISSANSIKLGILRIDPDRVIFQKSIIGILSGYSIFSAISFRVINAWYLEFLIIGLLYLWSVLFGIAQRFM